ncbi:hypothetical protein BGX38DRAFT_1204418 [Terfezia claveryi]|nr:hypothetical protein BGX38DRAFT_1204418 [Terfezia claveryi]
MSRLPRTPPGNERNLYYPDINSLVEEEEDLDDLEEVPNLEEVPETTKDTIDTHTSGIGATGKGGGAKPPPIYKRNHQSNQERDKMAGNRDEGLKEMKLLMMEMEKRRNNMLEKLQKTLEKKFKTFEQRILSLELRETSQQPSYPIQHILYTRAEGRYVNSTMMIHSDI